MSVLGTLVTFTTYGTWLRGDARGWSEHGVLWSADPMLELADYDRLRGQPYFLPRDQLLELGSVMCGKLQERLGVRLLALTVQTWHVHFVAPATTVPLSDLIKCAKESVRFFLRVRQRIWTADADKRFCFEWERLRDRVHYVEQHNERNGWPVRPWALLWDWDEYVRYMVG